MENIDLMRIPDEAMEDGNDVVDRVDSDSSSISNSSSDSDVGDHPDSGSDSDSDSAKSEVISDTEESDSFADGPLVRVRETEEQDQFVKNYFLTMMSGLGMRTAVEAVYKNVCPGFTWQAKVKSFQEISRNLEGAGEGLGKVKLAWFGGSKDEINNIVRYGFTSRGRGICLSPVNLPTASISGCVADENGLYHMILCRAILGKSELLTESPEQRFPSSEEFHSAADNLASPRVYMVWSSYMNTHVMPQYVVSFRPPVKANGGSAIVRPAVQANPARANEGVANAATSGELMIPVAKLILELGTGSPMNIKRSLIKIYGDFREKKITKQESIQKLRQLVGVDVLYRTVMSLRRRPGESEEAAPGGSNSAVAAQRKLDANRVLKNLQEARRSA